MNEISFERLSFLMSVLSRNHRACAFPAPGLVIVVLLPVLLILFSVSFAFAGRLALAPSLALDGEYNDNIFLVTEEEVDEGEEVKTEDYILTARPGLRLRYDTIRLAAFAGGSVGIQSYYENEEENRLPSNVTMETGLSYWFGPKTQVGIEDNLTFFYDPRESFGTDTEEVLSVRTGSINNGITLNARRIINRLSIVDASYTFSTMEYEDSNLFDVVRHLAEASWNRRVSERHTLVVFGRYARNLYNTEFDFMRRHWDSDARMDEEFPYQLKRSSDFDSYVPGLGLVYQITPSLAVQVRSGLVLPVYYVDENYRLDEIDWYQRLGMNYQYRRYRFNLIYERDLIPASGVDTAVLNQRYGIGFDQVWTRRFVTGLSHNFTRADHRPGIIDAYRSGVTASYYFFTWLGLSAGYQRYEQFSVYGAGPEQTIKTNRFLLSLSVGMPNPDWLSVTL